MDEKVKLLIKYQAVDDVEREAFETLAGVVREICHLGTAPGGLDMNKHGLLCWHKICMPMSSLAKVARIDQGTFVFWEDHRRMHSFDAIVWDPRFKWLEDAAERIRWQALKKAGSRHRGGFSGALIRDLDSYGRQNDMLWWEDEDVDLWMDHLKHVVAWKESVEKMASEGDV